MTSTVFVVDTHGMSLVAGRLDGCPRGGIVSVETHHRVPTYLDAGVTQTQRNVNVQMHAVPTHRTIATGKGISNRQEV